MGLAWIPLAIASYLMQAINGAIDRAIVHKEVTKPIVISFWVAAFSVGTFGIILLGFLPGEPFEQFEFESPTAEILGYSLLSGFMTQAGLLYMFRALEDGEATRVLSSLGALTPIIAFVAAYMFIDERLGSTSIIAFALLILATVVLARSPTKKLKVSKHPSWIVNTVLAAAFLGLQTVIIKYVFDNYHFFSAFALTGLGAGVYVIVIATLSQKVRNEIYSLFGKKSTEIKNRTSSQVWWIIGNSALGGVAAVVLNIAIDQGSPSLVNALRGVQYAGVFVIALILAHKFPNLLDEDLSKKSIMLKLIGIVLIVIGVILLAVDA